MKVSDYEDAIHNIPVMYPKFILIKDVEYDDIMYPKGTTLYSVNTYREFIVPHVGKIQVPLHIVKFVGYEAASELVYSTDARWTT